MLETVLIANRGEIALRVIRGCRAAGLRSVAIYSDLDRSAPHVREADDAVRVESYLDIDEVVAAARAWGWDEAEVPFFEYSERSLGQSKKYFDALSAERGTPVKPRLSLGALVALDVLRDTAGLEGTVKTP